MDNKSMDNERMLCLFTIIAFNANGYVYENDILMEQYNIHCVIHTQGASRLPIRRTHLCVETTYYFQMGMGVGVGVGVGMGVGVDKWPPRDLLYSHGYKTRECISNCIRKTVGCLFPCTLYLQWWFTVTTVGLRKWMNNYFKIYTHVIDYICRTLKLSGDMPCCWRLEEWSYKMRCLWHCATRIPTQWITNLLEDLPGVTSK